MTFYHTDEGKLGVLTDRDQTTREKPENWCHRNGARETTSASNFLVSLRVKMMTTGNILKLHAIYYIKRFKVYKETRRFWSNLAWQHNNTLNKPPPLIIKLHLSKYVLREEKAVNI